jgi:hypothetical protein
VIAHDVSAAEHRKADRSARACGARALARVVCNFAELDAAPRGRRFAERECCARRRVLLVTVMGFEDLDVVARIQLSCSQLNELEQQVHAEAHVRRNHDRDFAGGGSDLGTLRVVVTSRADDERPLRSHTGSEIGGGRLRQRELDGDVCTPQRSGRIAGRRRSALHDDIGTLLHGRDHCAPHSP